MQPNPRCDTGVDQFAWTDVAKGARCGGNKVGAEAAPFYVHHPAYAQEDDDSCTYNEVCDGAGSCTMDAANCIFAPSCGVNPAPNTCVADVGDNCKDFNADDVCDDNAQTCAYASKGTAASFVCRAEVDACNLASTCTDAKGVHCPETAVDPLITVTKTVIEHSPLAPWLDNGQGATESAVEIIDRVEPTEGAPAFLQTIHFLSWPTEVVEVLRSDTVPTHSHLTKVAGTAATVKTKTTGVAHACGELSYSLGVSKYTADSACNFWITAGEAVDGGAFRYAPSYQTKRVDLRDGAYAWYNLEGDSAGNGGVANSAAAPGAYPYPHVPAFPRTPEVSVAGSLDGTLHGALDAVEDHLADAAHALRFDGVDNYIALPQSPLAGGVGDFTITVILKPGGPLMGINPATWRTGRRGILGFADAPSLTMVDTSLEFSVNQPAGDGSADPKFVRHTTLIENVFTEHRC
jgi:hypothetical protein